MTQHYIPMSIILPTTHSSLVKFVLLMNSGPKAALESHILAPIPLSLMKVS